MNTDAIDKAFADLIAQRAIHHKLGVTDNYVQQLRSMLKNDKRISTDLKLALLQKSGWQQDDHEYNQQDLVSLAKFILKASAAAKEHGAEYLVEKWQKTN